MILLRGEATETGRWTKVGSNEMPFTGWKHTERNRQRDIKKYVMIA